MKVSVIAILVLALLVSACQSTVEPSATTVTGSQLPDRPELAVDQMVAALMLNDVEAIRELTPDHQLALIVALEGGPQDELSAMIDVGVPEEVAVNFWTSFANGLPDLVGVTVEDMEFGTSIPKRVRGVEFISFPVMFGTDSAGTEWFVRSTDRGWQIDLLATFAGPFASALESLVERTTDPAVLEVIRGEVPSFEAAYERHVELGSSDRVQTAIENLLEALLPEGETLAP